MGDVVQPISMEHLLASVTRTGQCFYYAHPVSEKPSKGFHIGEFFGGDKSKLIDLSSADRAWEVNRFKALVVGGGGFFSEKHPPLFVDMFVEAITVPIVVMGVGANYHAKDYNTLLQKVAFVSGRDPTSVERLVSILSTGVHPAVRPGDVWLVKDPVLSDKALTDTTGACWGQSSGGHQQQPLCFVLPAANNVDTIEMHRQLRAKVVRRGDRFINVISKHQEELVQFHYPGTVEEIVDPMEYVKQLCSCKAIISTRFHGAILGLHMGVPTFGAFHVASENKVPDLMIDTMSLPDQFFLVDENLDREVVDWQVAAVRRSYEHEGRREGIHGRLSRPTRATPCLMSSVSLASSSSSRILQSTRNQHYLPVGGGAKQLPKEAEGRFNGKMTKSVGGEDYLTTIALLFTIVGLAFMPSAAGGEGRGSRQQPCEAADVDGDHISASNDGQGRRLGHSSFVQKEVDAFNGTIPEHSIILLERTAAAALEPSPSPPLLGCSDHAPNKDKLSNTLFAVNFVLWIALAVAFSKYSKSYLRDTHDPVGLLALQGMSGSVVLFFVGRLGPGGSDAGSSNNGAPSTTCGPPGLQTQLVSASRRETLAAVLHSGQALLTNLSLFVGGVAVTNALKAMEPVAATVASYFLLGRKVAPGGVAALAIIVAGILLLTSEETGGGGRTNVEEATDNERGERHSSNRMLVSAAFTIAAVSCNALRNVVIKGGDPIPPHRTLLTCSVALGTVGVALMLLRLVCRRMDKLLIGGDNGVIDVAVGSAQFGSWLSMDGVNAALCFVGYNFASFNLLARLSPVGHAVGNSVKRVVMLGSGIVLMGETMTAWQLTGAAVALVGVGVYNLAGKRK